jgi:FkbM family methyltransferase
MSLATAIEKLWLRALPTLTREYMWVSVDGLRIYGTREHHVMLYWLLRGKYERHTRTLFEQAVKPGMHVLDIGAHVGYFTLLAARAVGPTGRVSAFEPDPSNYRFLCHNVALNGMEEVVTAVRKAVAEASGSRPFFVDERNSACSALSKAGRSGDAMAVECTAVDDFVEPGEGIDVVKLDVEGGELDALRGMRRTLADAARVVMFVECNPSALASASVSVSDLLDELRELDLVVQVIDEGGRRLAPVTDEMLRPEMANTRWYANLYCTRGV